MPAHIDFSNLAGNKQMQLTEHISYTAPSLGSANDFGKNCVTEAKNKMMQNSKNGFGAKLKPASINFFRFKVL